MKERLATEKLYLEDEIRLDQNIGNTVGGTAAFQSVLKSVQIVAPTDSTVLIHPPGLVRWLNIAPQPLL